MTLRELLEGAYSWLLAGRVAILLAAVVIPVAGTLLARIGKAGKSDSEGRWIASLVVGVGLSAIVLEVVALFIAHAALDRTALDADALLLVAPIVCLVGCLAGIRWVFPLNELASVQTFRDVGAFVLASLAALWLLSKFRGWGILFFGGLTDLVVLGLLLFAFLKRLYRRAFRVPGPAPAE